METEFNAGDLVWAKVNPHPWWPGIVYHEDLSSTEAQQSKKEGFMLVSFFGDNAYKWLDPRKLVPFESNYDLYSNRSRSCLFVKAVSEAIYEVNYRAAVGLTCPCSFFTKYRPAPVNALVEVDIDGYKLGGVFTVKQIERFRQEFRPVETLSFIQKLALDSTDVHKDLNHSKEVARALAFRKARYAEIDEPYFHAFGVDPRRLQDPIVALNDQKINITQVPTDHPPEAKSQGQRQLEVKHQNKTKKSPAPQKYKLQASETKCSEKQVKHQFLYTKSSEDRVPKKKKRSKGEAEKRLDFSSSTTLVKEQPSGRCPKHKDSPPTSKPLKKRHKSIRTTPLALSPQNKRKKGENSTTVKKHQVESRTIISMRFPPDAALPSASELKAKFARFGPLDTLSVRISWFKSRCSLVFIHKSDAEEAYAYAVNNKKLFGQTKVNYRLQPANFTSLGNNRPHQETPVNPIICRYQEIYARYREEADRTHVQVGLGSVDISEKMLHLLNDCSRIVLELKPNYHDVSNEVESKVPSVVVKPWMMLKHLDVRRRLSPSQHETTHFLQPPEKKIKISNIMRPNNLASF